MLPELIQYLNTLVSPDTENTNKRKHGSTANDCCSRDSNAFCSWAILRRGVVSVTYQDKLNTIPHGCHANKNLFPPPTWVVWRRRVVLVSWSGGGIWADMKQEISVFGEAELCFSCQPRSPQSALTQTVTSQCSGVTKTFKRPQQMDNTVWLKGRFGLQIN